MIKKISLLFFLLLGCNSLALAKEIPVKIKPIYKITTSNALFTEGDSLDFVVAEDVLINSKVYFNKGQKVIGIITSREENDYLVTPAKLYIENFRTQTAQGKPIKLSGFIYKSGNKHDEIMEFFNPEFIRGGEVQIKPEKDEFTIYAEENL